MQHGVLLARFRPCCVCCEQSGHIENARICDCFVWNGQFHAIDMWAQNNSFRELKSSKGHNIADAPQLLRHVWTF
jgi:hypothetical protein